ncbi:thioredoxin domain-containing protein 5 [Lepeophtheirus salmonis]|uniref:thioredoxin domain-containing protein 5 n=1 Tax=Lepeophtheirus salmonis TaxID=72036 RepID=UPI001AE76F49|nr:thioredoxin domain-containing protein 5-like [Lepeophtheirus salmonis]
MYTVLNTNSCAIKSSLTPKMYGRSLCLVLTLLLSVVNSEDSPLLNKESFISLKESGAIFVKFFAPWCSHCKRLAPTWETLAKEYTDKDVKLARVDCTIETEFCSDMDVTGYPTLKFFGKEEVKYRGQRDEDSLVKFIETQMGRIKPEETIVSAEEVKVENGLHVLSEDNFKAFIGSGNHFIKFYAPWCGHCQKLSPIWDELASEFKDNANVKIAKMDCTQAQDICQEQDVTGYPTLSFYRDGQKVESYRGSRAISDLKDFVQTMTDVPKPKDTIVEGDSAPSSIIKINKEEFKENIASGVTFIKFYAPWCGHCKRLAPIWEELAVKFEGVDYVKIAKVDCTANDNKNKELCNEEGVNGFPTLNIYASGEKVKEYRGNRKVEDLEEFVKEHSKFLKEEL